MSRNRGSKVCECGLDFVSVPMRDSDLITEDAYLTAIGWPDCPYRGNGGHGWSPSGYDVRFRKIVCPTCEVEYAGWYYLLAGEWWFFDTSYWSNFNDEPGAADVRNKNTVTPPCGQDKPHGKSYDTGSWAVGGFAAGTHSCPCGGDGVVWLNLSSSLKEYDGLRFETRAAFCVPCATALRDGLTCEIKVPDDSRQRT